MRRIRAAALALLFTLALVVNQAGTANAVQSKVSGKGTVVLNGTTYDFSFSGADVDKGGYTILDSNNPKTQSLTGKASCFRQFGDYAVVAGPATYRNTSILGGGAFVLIIAFDSPISDAFDAIDIQTTNTLVCPDSKPGSVLTQIKDGSITVTP